LRSSRNLFERVLIQGGKHALRYVDGLISSSKMKKIIKALGIGNESDSDFTLKEQNSAMDFYSGKREIGPKFKILGIEYEKKP